MSLARKGNQVICFCDLQYRWSKRSTPKGVELTIELNEGPNGQQLIAQCPKIFRADMVEEMIDKGYELGWEPETQSEPLILRWTKKGIIKV